MDMKRKQQLIEEYKNRKPEMGVISFRCKATGEVFLGIAKDIQANFNSTRFKLTANYHPNKRLQELWNRYGEKDFELSVLKRLKYEDPLKDHTEELEELRDQCFAEDSQRRKIWR